MSESTEEPWFLESEESLEEFLCGFREGTFPKAGWTHGAHVVMAASTLWAESVRVAPPTIRAGIQKYNESQGTANTATNGYHETLTRLWVGLVAAFLASLPADTTRVEAARAAHDRFAKESGLFKSEQRRERTSKQYRNSVARACVVREFLKSWYSFDVVKSVQARAEWVALDLAPNGHRKP